MTLALVGLIAVAGVAAVVAGRATGLPKPIESTPAASLEVPEMAEPSLTPPVGPSVGAATASPAGAPPANPSGTTTAAPSSSPSSGTPGQPSSSLATVSPSAPPEPTATALPASGPFPGGLLIADRGNGRLLIVDGAKRVLWKFPVAGSLPRGQAFSADDAFLSPDGRSIAANEENHQLVVRIDIASDRIVWQYGHYDAPGSAPGFVSAPDDAYPLANGDIVVADIANCRVIEIAPDKRISRQWGRTGVCVHDPPTSYAYPNGDTPLADGGLLVTEIVGAHVVRLDAAGHVVFDVHVPVSYPSDAQLDPAGNVVVSDYSNPGAIVAVDCDGEVLWRYGPATGPGRLDHPSLAVPRPDGTVLLNDDFRARVLLIDPHRRSILWQYGRTDHPGRGAGELNIPDGIDQLPAGFVLP